MGKIILVNYIIIEYVLASAHLRRDFGESMKEASVVLKGKFPYPSDTTLPLHCQNVANTI